MGDKTGLGFRDAATGFAAGETNAPGILWFYVTHDGGRTWRPQPLPLPSSARRRPLAVAAPTFFTARIGVLAVTQVQYHGLSTTFYRTQDGGATWRGTTPLASGAVTHPLLWQFIDMQHGWATAGAQLSLTGNGGTSWTSIAPVPSLRSAVALDFVSSRLGWAVARVEGASTSHGLLLKTTDGGRTWRREPNQVAVDVLGKATSPCYWVRARL